MTTAPGARRRGWLPAALAGAAAVCLAAGTHLLSEPAQAVVADAGAVPNSARVANAAGAPDAALPAGARALPAAAGVRPARAPLPTLALPPVTFQAPALRLRAPVVPVGTDPAGSLQLPDDPGTLGWWAGGALPGAAHGTVVLAGHLDTLRDGPGVMAAVVHQRVGVQVGLVDSGGSTTTYRVVAVRSYPKSALPRAVFAETGQPRLVLITCGGAFDQQSHHYSDNVVVYAVPVAA